MNEEFELVCAELRDLAYTPLPLPQLEWYNGKFAIAVQFKYGTGETEDKAELAEFARKHDLDYSTETRKMHNASKQEEVVILRQWTTKA